MKRNIIGGVAVSALLIAAPLSSAGAADMPLKAPPPAPVLDTWTGFYVGADIGGAWARDVVSPTVADGGTFPRSNTLSPDGIFGGGTFGFNYQSGGFVFGLETDLGGMGLSQSRHDPHGGTEVDILSNGVYGDVTGRLGFAFDRVLVYAKGGGAFFLGSAQTTTGIPGFTVTPSGAFTGWTAGGGVEYKIYHAWSIKAEYLHFDFGSQNAILTGGAGVFPYRNALTVDTVKIGINYQLGPVQ